MKNLTKKIMIFSMVGMMQIGFGAAVLEASPLHNNNSNRVIQFDDRHDQDGPRDRHDDHDERLRRENERHENEMKRRHHESDREWHERQERERQQHDDNLREIGALLIGIVIGSQQ
jgi:hypothetical protein